VLSAVAKAYVVVSVVVAAFTVVYLDPLSLGPQGGGDLFGGTLLVATVIGTLAFAVVASLRPVTDCEVEPPPPAADAPPAMRPVTSHGPLPGSSVFPFVGAVGLFLVAVAAATGSPAFYLAVALLAMAAAGWLGQVFAEHPLTTARLTERVSRRTVNPFTYPVLAVLLGAVVAISISRVYLTVTEDAAIVVSGLTATLLFVGCLVLASGQNLSRRVTAGLAGIALASVVGAGAASAARGERAIEHHGEGDVTEQELRAEGIQYNKSEITLTEGKVRFSFENEDPKDTYHNVGIYSEKVGGQPFAAILPIKGGGTKGSTLIDTKVVGLLPGMSYWFRCDFHPAMVGTVHVAPAPAEKKVEKH